MIDFSHTFMTSLQIILILCWAACAAGLAAYVVSVAHEITYVTLADGRKTERKLPLVFRLLLPFVPNLARFVRSPRAADAAETANRTLLAAGFEGLLSGREFIALKILLPLVCGGAWTVFVLLLATLTPGSFWANSQFFLALSGVLLAAVYPAFWLRAALRRRHLEIFRALPFVLDLLTLSVEAGMDFMSALQRNCERRALDPLNEELIRMIREIQIGTPRRVALRHLADRVNQPDLRGVTHALIQADELGVSIGSILRIQSDQLRGRRFDRAEKLAGEAPVKMLGPLMLFIFPAVFIILLAPLLTQAAGHLF